MVKSAPKKLDLACGNSKQPGFFGVDRIKTDAVDLVRNLEQYPWPWADSSIEEIWCSHYIEHTEDLVKFMEECHRILVPGGKITVVAPYYSSMRAWQDPTHKRAVSEATFLYFNQNWLKENRIDHYGISADFDFTYGYAFFPAWQNRSEEARQFALTHYINVVSDIQVVLTKRA